jgi:hypothetical protein
MNRQRIILVFVLALVAALGAVGTATAGGGIGGGAGLPQPAQAEGGGGGTCWGAELQRSKGWWPYRHRLFLYTVWCGSGGRITYRSSTARTAHDSICWTENGPHVAKTAGGAGYSFVEVQSWAGVACHSALYFISFHDTLMLRVRYYPNGYYQTVAWG